MKAIEDGKVVPVIGSQLLILGADNQLQTLQRLAAEQLLRLRDTDPCPSGQRGEQGSGPG